MAGGVVGIPAWKACRAATGAGTSLARTPGCLSLGDSVGPATHMLVAGPGLLRGRRRHILSGPDPPMRRGVSARTVRRPQIAATVMLHVVVVDDDARVRMALKRLLRAIGHDVQVFSSAEDFLAQDVAADCVILDVHLPGLSGLDVEERLSRGGADPAVVFITGYDSPPIRAAFERARRPWLRKPFDEQGLIDAISRATAPAALR